MRVTALSLTSSGKTSNITPSVSRTRGSQIVQMCRQCLLVGSLAKVALLRHVHRENAASGNRLSR